jgi:periplasmic divalent cation tolerance protein
MNHTYFIVFCSCPDEASAAGLARTLVEERLAGCISRVPGVTSTYRWEGRVQEDAELLLVIKTTGERLATLSARIEALHPYEVPEIIAVEIGAGSERYLGWLGQTVVATG